MRAYTVFFKFKIIGEMTLMYMVRNMYLLTEWEGRTGKYLARGQGVRIERSEVRTS